MPVKIRLARHGRKRKPFYHIVVADSRSPRDGRLIERIGSYDPNTNPATIVLDFDKALSWLQKGAQPTDTARTILSTKGVMHMNHLLKGAQKGAFTEEVAKEKFNDWLEEKESRIQSVKEEIKSGLDKEAKSRLSAESKVNQARAEALAAAQSELAEEAQKAADAEKEAQAVEEAASEA